jgi:hypothetical protein
MPHGLLGADRIQEVDMRTDETRRVRAGKFRMHKIFTFRTGNFCVRPGADEYLAIGQLRHNACTGQECIHVLSNDNSRVTRKRVGVDCRNEHRVGLRIRLRNATEWPGAQSRPQTRLAKRLANVVLALAAG